MGNPNSYFFDDNEDKLDEGEELEIAPENPSGDDDNTNADEESSGNGMGGISSFNVVNETSQQVSDILDSGDDDDGDD